LRREVLFVVVVLAVVLVVGPFAIHESRFSPFPFSYQCTDAYNGLDSPKTNSSSATQAFPIVSVPRGQVAVLCVAYHDNNKNQTEVINMTGEISVGEIQTSSCPEGSSPQCTSSSFVNSTDFEILSNITSATLGGSGPSEVTVAYAIVPKSGTSGFYWLNIASLGPISCGLQFPFAYGHSFTGANSSGAYFPYPRFFIGCIEISAGFVSQIPYASLVGVSRDTMLTSVNCGGFVCDTKQS